MTGPPPTLQGLDGDPRRARRAVQRYRWTVITVAILVLGGLAGWTAWQLHAELSASCGAWRVLAGTPVKPVPPLTRPSELAVLIVIESRTAYQAGCGPLPALPASTARWAAYYGLPVS